MKIPRLAAAAAMLAPGLAFAQGVEVARVDLGQSGLALYELRADVEGDQLVFTVPETDADDVLGSLVVRDPAGGVLGLRTDTPDSAPEALRGTRFADGAPRDLPSLLAALVGSSVTLTTSEGAASGIVLGLGTREVVHGETVLATPTALILNEGLIREVVLEPGASVAVEADQSGVLTEASGLAFDADTTRRFELDLEGNIARDVALSYLTEAPAWKNSWRLLLGEGRLQGWATVENVSGQPWSGVALTLSTGAPVAYARDLLSPRRFARLDPPDFVGERPKVRADEGFAESADVAFAAPPALTQSGARMGAMAEAPIAAPSAPAEAVRGIANVRYTVPYPVELGAGRTANLLYIDLAVDAKVHALYQPGSSEDILLAARLTADQPLAPGLVSVRDETGFVGDAPFTGLDAGQVRLLPYAAAPQATVRQSRSERGASIDLVAAGGALRLELREEVCSRYAAEVPDGVDVFVVEHPRSNARLVRTNGEVEENANFLRISVPVTDGEAEVTLLEQRVNVQRYALDGSGLRAVIDQVALGSAKISDEDRAVIEAAAAIIRTIDEAEARLNDLQVRYETLNREQERLRANLQTVKDGALRERYEASMLATEDEIAATLDGMESARAAIREGEAALDETVRRML